MGKRQVSQKTKNAFRSMLFHLLIAFTVAIYAVAMSVATIGYERFSSKVTDQYENAAYNAGATVKALIESDLEKGGDIDKYIADNLGKKQAKGQDPTECGFTPEYTQLLISLEVLCDTQDVSMIYVIKLTDEFAEPGIYTTYYSVFDVLTKEDILPSYFAPWAVGDVNLKTQTIKEEDRDIYTQIWRGDLDKASVVQLQEKDSDMFDHITSLMPIKNPSGKVTAIVCVQQPMQGIQESRRSYMGAVGALTFALTLAFIILSWLYLEYAISRPLRRVATEAARFAQDTTKSDKPLKTKIKSRVSEIYTLVQSLDDMEQDTLDYINNIETINAEKQKMGAELDIAKSIQENFLPHDFPPFPERHDISLYASMTPAKAVGGDFYDFFFIDEDHLALVIADVSGKGVPAALFMMVTRILINELAKHLKGAANIITAVNDRITDHNPADMFVTIWFGILDLKTGVVDAVNAGHDNPAIYKKGGFFALQEAKHGFIVGGMKGVEYRSYEFTLNPGDKLFLYTDGVPEATRSDKAMFKTDGMIASLQNRKEMHPARIIEGVKKDVERFVGDAPQFDDMTMLCIEYIGDIEEKTLEIDAVDENLDKVNAFIEEALCGYGCKPKMINQMLLAAEEVFVNIAHYAYKPKTGKAEIKVLEHNKTIKLVFIDSGKAYNPLDRKDPDITLAAEDRNIGGLGIFMTKKLVSGAFYKRKGNKNILVLEKEI